MTNETDDKLANLAKIELGFSKIYEHFSKNKKFTGPVKKFWENLAAEEQEHANIFMDIQKKASDDPSYKVEITIESNELKDFVKKVNNQLKKIRDVNFSESEAYSFGANLEANLCEAKFIERIITTDEMILKRLKIIRNVEKKHSVVMINYSKGIK